VIVLARKYVDIRLHVLQTITEQFLLCEWGRCHLGKLHGFFQNVWIMGCT
jgi:hypothetical protein